MPTVLMTFTQDNAKTKTKQVGIACLALLKNLEISKGQIYQNTNKCVVGKCNRQPNIERGILLHQIQFLPRLAFRSCEEKEAMARLCQADQRKMESCKGSEMNKIIKTKSKVME